MNARVVDGEALPFALIQPDNFDPQASYPLLVFLHGFGASMFDLASLTPEIDPEGYVYAFPNAPYQVDLGGGNLGYSWSLNRPGILATTDDPRSIEERLDVFLAEAMAEASATPGQVLLAGFSQGGGLTLRYGLLHPEMFAGLLAMSASFREQDELRDLLPPARTQPVFLSHGVSDAQIPLERAHETKAFLEEAGYPLEYHEYDMGHAISQALIEDIKPWLRQTLPPYTPA